MDCNVSHRRLKWPNPRFSIAFEIENDFYIV